jgi:uncharacterized protein DUF3631
MSNKPTLAVIAAAVEQACARGGQRTTTEPAENGAAVMADLYDFLGRFVAYPSEHARIAHALWIFHAHGMEAWESTPRLAFLSPEPGSGKTRALEITETLVPRPCESVNMTTAYLFRRIASEDQPPTLLLDEVDALFKGRGPQVEDIRALINAGHRRGARVGRCVNMGKTIETEDTEAYCAVVLAGVGWLPDTLMSRSVIIRMRRRAPDEIVSPYRRRYNETEGHELRDRIGLWAGARITALSSTMPDMPPGVEDRAADMWEPLLAVADAIGGEWPARARAAAVSMVGRAKEANPSLGIQLLADIRTVFRDAKALPTELILAGLYELPEAPWKTLAKGLALSANDLARHLREYDIRSTTVKPYNKRGYYRAHFEDAWRRYIPVALSPGNGATGATNATNGSNGCGTPTTNVLDATEKANEINEVAAVAAVAPPRGNIDTGSQKFAALAGTDNDLGIPEFLDRNRKPALGPDGDSLDDFEP